MKCLQNIGFQYFCISWCISKDLWFAMRKINYWLKIRFSSFQLLLKVDRKNCAFLSWCIVTILGSCHSTHRQTPHHLQGYSNNFDLWKPRPSINFISLNLNLKPLKNLVSDCWYFWTQNWAPDMCQHKLQGQKKTQLACKIEKIAFDILSS